MRCKSYCSLTNHMWDGFWLLANRRAFERLSPGDQEVVTREFNAAALAERDDVAKLNAGLQGKLAGGGLKFNAVETAAFRKQLADAGFYRDWHAKYGDEAWGVLEGAVGTLS